MWNLELGQEIILMAITISVISWYMGRVLCTSKEDQIRSINKQLRKDNKRLKNILDMTENDLYQYTQQLKIEKKQLIDSDHQHNLKYSELDAKYHTHTACLKNLQKEHDSVLKKLQKLSDCNEKFAQLSKQYKKQSVDVIIIEDVLKNTKKDLRDRTRISKEFEQQFIFHKDENKQLSQKNSEQLERISALNILLKSTKLDLEQSHSQLREKNNKIADFKTQNKHLNDTYLAEVKEKQSVKKKLKDTQNQLNSHVKQIKVQQDSLEKCQKQCNELKYEIKTYKILSTIG